MSEKALSLEAKKTSKAFLLKLLAIVLVTAVAVATYILGSQEVEKANVDSMLAQMDYLDKLKWVAMASATLAYGLILFTYISSRPQRVTLKATRPYLWPGFQILFWLVNLYLLGAVISILYVIFHLGPVR